ncbi:MAG: cold-shock protein, partial [Gemmatimonadales bacterium]
SGGVRKNATPAKHRGKKETGQVKWFRGSKGYGFITPDNGGEDYFVHRSSVKNGNLNQGDRVEFVVTKDDKGRIAAENVVKI